MIQAISGEVDRCMGPKKGTRPPHMRLRLLSLSLPTAGNSAKCSYLLSGNFESEDPSYGCGGLLGFRRS